MVRYKKTKRVALIKNTLGGGEHIKTIFTRKNRRYVKYFDKYTLLSKKKVVGYARRK